MSQLSLNFKIYNNIVDKCAKLPEKSRSLLFGVINNNCLYVIGSCVYREEDEYISTVQEWFPGEVYFCGLLDVDLARPGSDCIPKLFEEVSVIDTPLYLEYESKSKKLKASILDGVTLVNREFSIFDNRVLLDEFIYVQAQTTIPIITKYRKESIEYTFDQLKKEIAAGHCCFHFPNTSIYLIGKDSESTITDGKRNIDEVRKSSSAATGDPVKTKDSYPKMEIISVDILNKITLDTDTTPEQNNHAPILNITREPYRYLSIPVKLDALTMIHRNTQLVRIYNMLLESLCRNVSSYASSFLRYVERRQNNDTLIVPNVEPCHFYVKELGHWLTRMYPDTSEIAERQNMHAMFHLPVDRPIFRKANAYVPSPNNKEEVDAVILMNPHEYVKPSGNGGNVYTVKGKYLYYHYNQQKFNDDGWGCAYRSLQTICSWLKLQGFTNQPVPTHREIQESLVRVGDKPRSFVGSRQWIGSTEVQLCLSNLTNVTSRILHVSSGEELASLGPDLTDHFLRYGCPVMIGGGVLAHTIIGIDYNRTNGNIMFLILDPHYTGEDELKTILSKGWVGWKPSTFWKKDAFYNLCMPQISDTI